MSSIRRCNQDFAQEIAKLFRKCHKRWWSFQTITAFGVIFFDSAKPMSIQPQKLIKVCSFLRKTTAFTRLKITTYHLRPRRSSGTFISIYKEKPIISSGKKSAIALGRFQKISRKISPCFCIKNKS